MSLRHIAAGLATVAAATAALVGCIDQARQPNTTTTPNPAVTAANRPFAADPKCGPVTELICDNGKICPVIVFSTGANDWHVFPHNLIVTKPKAKILWVMLDGSNFRSGDGFFPKGADSLFPSVQRYPVDVLDPAGPRKASGPFFRAHFDNDGSAASKQIKYDLKFHDANNNQIVCDPHINNSGIG